MTLLSGTVPGPWPRGLGRAYGFSVENAYVVDERTGSGFFLAVTLYTNQRWCLERRCLRIQTVADPFLAALGEAVARALWDEAKPLR